MGVGDITSSPLLLLLRDLLTLTTSIYAVIATQVIMTVWRISSIMIELFLQVAEIWKWPAFTSRVELKGCPWTAGNEPAEWLEGDKTVLNDILTFLDDLQSVEGKEARRAKLENKGKQGEEGRLALQQWFSAKASGDWKIKDTFLKVMEDNGLTPMSIINEEKLDAVSLIESHRRRNSAANGPQLPPVEQCSVRKLDGHFALALFGTDGVTGSGVTMRPPSYLVSYIGRIIANIWHHQALRISRDIKGIKLLEAEVEKKWQGECAI